MATKEIERKIAVIFVTDYVEAWIIHEGLFMGLSQNEKAEDIK